MKVIKRRPETKDCINRAGRDGLDKNNPENIVNPVKKQELVPKGIRRGSQAARRKQFMREYKKLYKETKRFVIMILKQNSDGFIKKGGSRVR